MKKIYTSNAINRIEPRMGLLRSILEQESIPYEIRNENIGSALGDVPAPYCYPEIWVLDDADYERASELVRDLD